MIDPAQAESGFTFGALYDLFKEKFPEHRTDSGRFDVPRFAKDLGMSPEGVYKWLRANKLTPEAAKRVVSLSQGAAEIRDFHKFVFA